VTEEKFRVVFTILDKLVSEEEESKKMIGFIGFLTGRYGCLTFLDSTAMPG
jgi:hypothetical protein